MEQQTDNNSKNKKGVRLYTIYLIIYTISLYLLLKNDLHYLVPFLFFILIVTENKFRKDDRRVTWRDLINKNKNK